MSNTNNLLPPMIQKVLEGGSGLLRLRASAYFILILGYIIFTCGTLTQLIQVIRCFVDPLDPLTCPIEGYRASMNPASDDDYQWRGSQNYKNAKGEFRNPADQSLGMYITMLFISINAFVGFSLSMLVVWLVDHRATPNGFTRLVQWFSICQVAMDFGFLIAALGMAQGYYQFITYNNSKSVTPFWNKVTDLGIFIQTLGDISSVMFTTVMAYTFFRIAQTQGAIDITQYLKYGVLISFGISITVSVLQTQMCAPPDWKNECDIIKARGWISVACIIVNLGFGILIWRMLARMKEGRKKDAISSLSSRILFYAGWVAFSRIGYIGLTLSTGTLNLNFADAQHTKLVNILSSLTYLMWLPTGTGFAIYYLYTHPEEYQYFWDLVCRRNGASFLPRDLCNLYDQMALAVCMSCGMNAVESADPISGTSSLTQEILLQTKENAANSNNSNTVINPVTGLAAVGSEERSTGTRVSAVTVGAGKSHSASLSLLSSSGANHSTGEEEIKGEVDYDSSPDEMGSGRTSAVPRHAASSSTSRSTREDANSRFSYGSSRSSNPYGRSIDERCGRQCEDDMLDACLAPSTPAAAGGRCFGVGGGGLDEAEGGYGTLQG